MTTEDIKAKTRDFMSKSFPAREIEDHDDIFALGFVNSLFAMQLVMFVEKEFGITVEDDDLDINNFRTIDAITNLVESKVV